MPTDQPPDNRTPGSFDFETIDLGEARKALDSLPEGLVDLTGNPEFWIDRRRKATPNDRALTGASIDWLIGLPSNIRPTKLCNQFPRIANALAEAWRDPWRCDGLLQSLANDRRGGRVGFPADVLAEIQRLTAYREAAT